MDRNTDGRIRLLRAETGTDGHATIARFAVSARKRGPHNAGRVHHPSFSDLISTLARISSLYRQGSIDAATNIDNIVRRARRGALEQRREPRHPQRVAAVGRLADQRLERGRARLARVHLAARRLGGGERRLAAAADHAGEAARRRAGLVAGSVARYEGPR